MNTKKILAALAVAGCALQLPAIVESANVVGYHSPDLLVDKQLMACNFYNVTSEGGININDLVPYDGDKVTHEFEIWWWSRTASGECKKGNNNAIRSGYYYVGMDLANLEYPIRPGDSEEWWDSEDGCIWIDSVDPADYVWATPDEDKPIRWVEKTFACGEGFFCKPKAANPRLTIAGGVIVPDTKDAYYPMTLPADKVLIANPFPTRVALNDIVPCDGEKISFEYEIWWWAPQATETCKKGNNNAIRSGFYYVGMDKDNLEYPIRPGDDPDWWDSEDGCIWIDSADPADYVWATPDEDKPIRWINKVFEAGEGFFCKPKAANPILKFPNPFYKPEN